jgi:hypothetical protein
MTRKKLDEITKLVNPSYNSLSIYEYEVFVELINRAFYKICNRDKEFNYKYSYLNIVEGDSKINKLFKLVMDYFIEGKGTKKILIEEVFPIINIINKCKNTDETQELKKQLLSVYDYD